ncbi:hypothetical protein PanWU01x14_095150, partial [Parasponia andersonii]
TPSPSKTSSLPILETPSPSKTSSLPIPDIPSSPSNCSPNFPRSSTSTTVSPPFSISAFAIFYLFYDPTKSQPFCRLTKATLRIARQESVAIATSMPFIVNHLV